jgi:hypothetical protein
MNNMTCLYWTCKHTALECDEFCSHHRMVYGLYRPQTYVQAYRKAKEAHERTGDRYFVYRHTHVKTVHKGYGTARVTKRNWVNAVFSEVVFPNEGLVSTHTAQKTMFALLGNKPPVSDISL